MTVILVRAAETAETGLERWRRTARIVTRTQRTTRGMIVVNLKLVAIASCIALWSTGALAIPITYTESATASGTLNGISFSNDVITLTGTADTTGVFDQGGVLKIDVVAWFSISGGGDGTFTDAMQVFNNPGFLPPAVGLDDGITSSVMATFNSAFASYNLASAIGPITGAPFINPSVSFETSAGPLLISTAGNSTFTATLPEPAALPLFATGLGVLGLLGWSRKRKAQALA